jgi:hypothetical protein
MKGIEDIYIYLKKVTAEVTTHDMANHSIFPTQALPNSLSSPFSYLKPEFQNNETTIQPWAH